MNKSTKFLVFSVILIVLTFNLPINSYAVGSKNISKLYFKAITPGITLEKDVFNTFKNIIKKTINTNNSYSYYFSNSKKENIFEIVTFSSEGKVICTDVSSNNLQIKNISEVKNIIGEPESIHDKYRGSDALPKFLSDDYAVAFYPEYGVLFIYSKSTGDVNRACYFEKCGSAKEIEYYAKMLQNTSYNSQ